MTALDDMCVMCGEFSAGKLYCEDCWWGKPDE